MAAHQANPNMVIQNLSARISVLITENCMLLAVVDELTAENEKLKKENELV